MSGTSRKRLFVLLEVRKEMRKKGGHLRQKQRFKDRFVANSQEPVAPGCHGNHDVGFSPQEFLSDTSSRCEIQPKAFAPRWHCPVLNEELPSTPPPRLQCPSRWDHAPPPRAADIWNNLSKIDASIKIYMFVGAITLRSWGPNQQPSEQQITHLKEGLHVSTCERLVCDVQSYKCVPRVWRMHMMQSWLDFNKLLLHFCSCCFFLCSRNRSCECCLLSLDVIIAIALIGSHFNHLYS